MARGTSSVRDYQMEAKIKTQKNPMPNFRAIKVYLWNYAVGIHGNYQESSDCFEYPKKSVLKSSYPKKYLPKFSNPKKLKSRNQKFQTQKNPSIIPVT